MSDILASIQARMKAPKDKRNDFGGYNYRNAESILRAFKEVQPDDVSLTMSDNITLVGEKLFLVATVRLHHGGTIIAQAEGAAMHALTKKGMDDAQITGACSSYARKYALCGLFAIDDSTDDPDGKDHRQDDKPKLPTFDPVAAHDRIARKLEAAKSADHLAEIWRDEADAIRDIKAAKPELEKGLVDTAKTRKAELKRMENDE